MMMLHTECGYTFKSGKRKGELCSKISCTKHNIEPNLTGSSVESLVYLFENLKTTPENKTIIYKKLNHTQQLSSMSTEYQKNINWLRHALTFPYSKMTYCIQDASIVYENLNKCVYGLGSVKEEILSFVCKRISNPHSNNNVLALHGSNGCGKTRLAHSLAEALGLPIRTINLGGVTDPTYFTGHGFTYVDSEPGRIVQILRETASKNCIIYFDELDKIHKTDKGQAIYSFLTHLIDSSQNSMFQDVYLSGLNLDVSNVFFVFSFNDETLIDVTVKDRLKIIKIPEPSHSDKIGIANEFLIPEICKNVNFDVILPKEIIEKVVRQCKSNGLRGIKRSLEEIVSKLNMVRMVNKGILGKMSFYDPDESKLVENIITQSITDGSEEWCPMYT